MQRAGESCDRFAGDVLHDEEELAAGGDDVEGRHHVGVPDPCGEARLVEEHRDELGVRRELCVQPLDRHGAGEADRAEQAPQMDRGHAASGDRLIEGVSPYDTYFWGGVAHAVFIVPSKVWRHRQKIRAHTRSQAGRLGP